MLSDFTGLKKKKKKNLFCIVCISLSPIYQYYYGFFLKENVEVGRWTLKQSFKDLLHLM